MEFIAILMCKWFHFWQSWGNAVFRGIGAHTQFCFAPAKYAYMHYVGMTMISTDIIIPQKESYI